MRRRGAFRGQARGRRQLPLTLQSHSAAQCGQKLRRRQSGNAACTATAIALAGDRSRSKFRSAGTKRRDARAPASRYRGRIRAGGEYSSPPPSRPRRRRGKLLDRVSERPRLGTDRAVLHVDDEQCRVATDSGRAPEARCAIRLLLLDGDDAIPGFIAASPARSDRSRSYGGAILSNND